MYEPMCAVEIHDLTVAYDSKPVLWDIDLTIPKGTLSAIIGPNGAGKTTLIKAVLGLLKITSGTIKFPVLGEEKWTNKIAYVPQNGSIDWDFPVTVLDVVMMGRYGYLGYFKRPGKKEEQMALDTLERVGMKAYANRQISRLSGGQQQRIFLARALVQQAEIYFMDEPFKGVDAQTEKVIVALLGELKKEGKTVIVVHHDLRTVEHYFDWVTFINLKILANGPVAETFNEANIARTYTEKQLLIRKEASL